MFDATTGVPAANASVSTIPKLSPRSDGAHSTSALLELALLGLVVDLAEHPHVPDVEQIRRELFRRSGRSRVSSVGNALAQRLERAQQQRQPLALDGLADEHDPQPLAGGRAAARAARSGSTWTPLGMTR